MNDDTTYTTSDQYDVSNVIDKLNDVIDHANKIKELLRDWERKGTKWPLILVDSINETIYTVENADNLLDNIIPTP